jgi:hypothetical protein
MNEWKKKWATRAPPEDVIEDLSFWLSTLNDYSSTRLCPLIDPTEINWVGDASTGFGIGVLIGRRWSQLRLKENWAEASPRRTIAWLETVAIRIGILMSIFHQDFPRCGRVAETSLVLRVRAHAGKKGGCPLLFQPFWPRKRLGGNVGKQ